MIYVMSDIHGNMRRFNSIMEQIDLQAEDTLYILGDVIDRHPDGLRILRRIMGMPNAKMLLGNHELMMLQALGLGYCEHLQNGGDPAQLFGRWYRNGGQVTHQHWKHLRKSLREEIANYLVSLPVNIDVTVNGIRYKLAHAEDVDTFDQAWDARRYRDCFEYAVWYRRLLEDTHPKDYTLVFGHTPTRHFQSGTPMRLFKDDHLIGIDCGCGYPDDIDDDDYGRGRLACLRLDDMKEFYSEEQHEEWLRRMRQRLYGDADLA